MAVIKQYDAYFGKIKHRVKIKCSGATGEFSIDLPKEAHGMMGAQVKAATLAALDSEYKKAALIFTKAAASVVKVIIIRFTDDVSFDGGISFSFECGVFHKTTWPKLTHSVEYVDVDSGIPSDVAFVGHMFPGDVERHCVTLPWSVEREQFLAQVSRAFIELIEKMKQFTKSKKSLLNLMSSQKALPAWPLEAPIFRG